ncbi:cohesin domain-containing protein [Patescibacteria group bacterium]|nr:cohesin domain-containing protein [Patescibacteria group bacterium]
MKHSCRILVMMVLVSLFSVVGARAVEAAPRLTLTPASGSYSNGTQFTVTIGVETDGQKAAGVDIWSTFDATKMEVVGITQVSNPAYGFAQISPNIDNTTGKFDMSFVSNSTSTYDAQALSGALATVTFRAKATGTASLNFTCSKEFTDSNIISADTTNTDLIDCASNSSGSYTITAGVGGDSSVTTTAATTPTRTLPKTGVATPTVVMVVVGVASVLSALALRWL